MSYVNFCGLYVALGVIAVSTSPVLAGKVVNGNFESGNTGFTSQYTSVSTLCGANGLYTVAANPAAVNCYGDWANIGDHTTGSGLMLIADGSTEAHTIIWSETIKVLPGTNYQLSYWATTVVTTDHGNFPHLRVLINGLHVGGALKLPAAYDGKWHKWSVTWNSGSATSVTIAILDADTEAGGNDFALDDIRLNTP